MVYTEMTKKAMKIAFEAHKNQTDKSGIPYIYHPIHLAEQMDDEESVTVALLHDVVEDTDWTLEQLKAEGFSNVVITALSYLTHDDSVPYMEYIIKIAENPIAKKVKLADLKHNSDLLRLDYVNDKAKKRVEKYKRAIQVLNITTCVDDEDDFDLCLKKMAETLEKRQAELEEDEGTEDVP